MSETRDPKSSTGRLRREREHHRKIAGRAEVIWQWDSPTGSQRARRRGAFFVEHGALAPGVRALEIGCGTGVFLKLTAPSRAPIDAVDLSIELLPQAPTSFPSESDRP